MFFALENKYTGKCACIKDLHKGEYLVNNSLYSGEKCRFLIEDYIVQHKKVRTDLKAAKKAMKTKQNIHAFLDGIKDPQIKDSIAAACVHPQFVDDYHTTALFIKE